MTKFESLPVAGAVFERNEKRREVVSIIAANRLVSPAVEWRRPGHEWRSSACSVSAWCKWVSEARPILEKCGDA